MMRCAAALCALLITCVAMGCRAPMPSFNIFAPYGPGRVPPPCTGSYGAPANYYRPGAAAVTDSAAHLAQNVQMTPATQDGWTESASLQQVAQDGVTSDQSVTLPSPSFGASIASASDSSGPIRIVETQSGSAMTPLVLNGMPAHDLTQNLAQTEPGRFTPSPDARAIPMATQAPAETIAAVTSTSTPAPAAATVSFSSAAPPQTTRSAAGAGDRGWRSRFQPAGS